MSWRSERTPNRGTGKKKKLAQGDSSALRGVARALRCSKLRVLREHAGAALCCLVGSMLVLCAVLARRLWRCAASRGEWRAARAAPRVARTAPESALDEPAGARGGGAVVIIITTVGCCGHVNPARVVSQPTVGTYPLPRRQPRSPPRTASSSPPTALSPAASFPAALSVTASALANSFL